MNLSGNSSECPPPRSPYFRTRRAPGLLWEMAHWTSSVNSDLHVPLPFAVSHVSLSFRARHGAGMLQHFATLSTAISPGTGFPWQDPPPPPL